MSMKKAFTLIELLVVIAVVTLLAGMLLGALDAAREEARKIACVNSERQMGFAYTMYRGDHGDKWPQGHSSSFGLSALLPYLHWKN